MKTTQREIRNFRNAIDITNWEDTQINELYYKEDGLDMVIYSTGIYGLTGAI